MSKKIDGLTPKEYARHIVIQYITGWEGGGLEEWQEMGLTEREYETLCRHVNKFLGRAEKAVSKKQKETKR